MDYKEKIYSKYASAHTESLYGGVTLERIKKQFGAYKSYFRKFLPEDKKSRILDMGCGHGGFVYWLQNMGFENVEGIDISGEQVEIAEKLGVKNVKKGDIFEFLGRGTNKYDIVFARDIMEHFSKDKVLEMLESVYGSLNDGGRLIIQTVNAENPLWGRIRHGDFTHDLAFTKNSMNQVLKVAGFKKVIVRPQRPVVHGFISLIRYVLWMLLEIPVRFFLLVETGSLKGILTQNILVVAEK